MKRLLGIGLAVAMIMGLSAGIAGATGDPDPSFGEPNKVWICHFADNHTADHTWSGGGTTLDGDWVLGYQVGMPLSNQVTYCEVTHGGNLLLVSVNAASDDDTKGHKVQLHDRTFGYPDGYKG